MCSFSAELQDGVESGLLLQTIVTWLSFQSEDDLEMHC